MKKIVFNLVLIAFFSLIIFLITLATIGIETNKFNKLISDKVSKTRNINLDLFTIKFKLDPKRIKSIFRNQRSKNKLQRLIYSYPKH